MNEAIPICIYCKHFFPGPKGFPNCAAYPDRIPDAILQSEVDHRRPFKGDHGIQFEMVPGLDEMPFDPFKP